MSAVRLTKEAQHATRYIKIVEMRMNRAINKIIRINYRLTLGFLRQPNLRAASHLHKLLSENCLIIAYRSS